jgi:hypothetical protein
VKTKCWCKFANAPYAYNDQWNSARFWFQFNWKCHVEAKCNARKWKQCIIFEFRISLQNSNENANIFVIKMHGLWCMNWIVHIKREMLQKEPSHLALWFESYAFLKFKFTWQRLIHISSTIHEKFMFLDFLEMGEQDLQLSCWTIFHLKLS